MNKTDSELQQDVESELRYDPKINAAHIGVTVDGGAVTLLGAVDTYPEKWEAVDTFGGKVTLSGHATSWQTIEDAASAAWSAPGVTDVLDRVKMQMTS